MDTSISSDLSASKQQGNKKISIYQRPQFISHGTFLLAVCGVQLSLTFMIELFSLVVDHKGVMFIMSCILAQIFAAIPLCIAQLLLGHYGMFGQINVWKITPIMFGLGYSMIIILLIKLLCESILATFSLMYVMSSFSHKVVWSDCQFSGAKEDICLMQALRSQRGNEVSNNESFTRPFSDSLHIAFANTTDLQFLKEGKLTNASGAANEQRMQSKLRRSDPQRSQWCTYGDKESSSFHYFSVNMQTQTAYKETWTGLTNLKWKIMIAGIFVWMIVAATTFIALNRILQVMTVLFVMDIIIFSIMIIVSCFVHDIKFGFDIIFTVSKDEFLNPTMWMDALTCGIETLEFVTGSMILLGSYVRGNLRPDTSTLYIAAIKFTVTIIFICFLAVIFGNEQHNVTYNSSTFYCTAGRGTHALFFPLVTSFLSRVAYGNLLSILFFAIVTFHVIGYVALTVTLAAHSLTESHRTLRRFRKYITIVICLCLIGIQILILTDCGDQLLLLLYYARKESTIITAIFFSVFVFLIYGARRLGDDMEFKMQVRLPKCWKILWILSILFSLLGLAHFAYIVRGEYFPNLLFYPNLIVLGLILSPILIVGLIIYFKYLKRHALMGLFKPTENWGPQDINIKKSRRKFDPRKSLNQKNIHEPCKHGCLIGSTNLAYEIEKLEEKKNQMLRDLENEVNSEDSGTQ